MTELVKASPFSFDRARLSSVIEPIVRAHGAEVVDVEFKSEQGGWVLRVLVEKLGSAESNLSTEQAAVDLELCTNVARELSPALDALDLIGRRYSLEVSSPGVERTLRGERDFVRFAGKKAKVKLATPVNGQKVITGIIGPLAEGAFALTEPSSGGARQHSISLDNVAHARLVFEFGPQPKPGKPGQQKKQKKK